MTEPPLALAPQVVDSDGIGELTDESRGSGPRFVSLAELPAIRVEGVVLANELLDNLPFDLVELTDAGWADVRVGLDPDDSASLVEVLVPLADDAVRLASIAVWAPDVAVGSRLPIQREAGEWVARAVASIERGRLVIIDYADITASLAKRPWHEWVRTYRGQDRGIHPLDAPGMQDITVEVAVDQLDVAGLAEEDTDQATFLRDSGIDDLVAEGRRIWEERAHLGDLTALKGRSRVTEAEALLDPEGLGAFRVLTWIVT